MDREAYVTYWNRAEPLMTNRLNALASLLKNESRVASTALNFSGDAEYCQTLDLLDAQGTVLISFDFILADAEERGEKEQGVGVLLNIVDADGEVLGRYAPNNYTSEVFTDDVDDMLLRIEDLDLEQVAALAKAELEKTTK
jgi:hypothetical protein